MDNYRNWDKSRRLYWSLTGDTKTNEQGDYVDIILVKLSIKAYFGILNIYMLIGLFFFSCNNVMKFILFALPSLRYTSVSKKTKTKKKRVEVTFEFEGYFVFGSEKKCVHLMLHAVQIKGICFP